MYRFARYNTKTGSIIATFSMSSNDSLPTPLAADEASLEIVDAEHLKLIEGMDVFRSRVEGLVEKSVIQELRVVPLYGGQIVLGTDTPDLDGDGRPELPADGKSAIKIRATLKNVEGAPRTDPPSKIRFTTTRGALSRRDVVVKDGVAEVELRAANETTSVLITATADGFEPGALALEVIPQADYDDFKREGRGARSN